MRGCRQRAMPGYRSVARTLSHLRWQRHPDRFGRHARPTRRSMRRRCTGTGITVRAPRRTTRTRRHAPSRGSRCRREPSDVENPRSFARGGRALDRLRDSPDGAERHGASRDREEPRTIPVRRRGLSSVDGRADPDDDGTDVHAATLRHELHAVHVHKGKPDPCHQGFPTRVHVAIRFAGARPDRSGECSPAAGGNSTAASTGAVALTPAAVLAACSPRRPARPVPIARCESRFLDLTGR
jgi:hypothetical protein